MSFPYISGMEIKEILLDICPVTTSTVRVAGVVYFYSSRLANTSGQGRNINTQILIFVEYVFG